MDGTGLRGDDGEQRLDDLQLHIVVGGGPGEAVADGADDGVDQQLPLLVPTVVLVAGKVAVGDQLLNAVQ